MAAKGDVAATQARARPIRSAPRLIATYAIVLEVITLGWGILAISTTGSVVHEWYRLVLVLVLALAFEEGARRGARLRLRMSSQLKRDMTSVWCVAAAVALRPGFIVILLASLLCYIWFRQQRPAGEQFFVKLFNASTYIVGALVAGTVARALERGRSDLPVAISTMVVVVVAAMVVYSAVNRALVTIYIVASGGRGRALLGSADDNLIEFATLCLGGLVAVVLIHQPWLVVLVIAPMVTLQRGALVRELETAATIDSKTGLLNAIAWEQLTQHELARAERDSQTLSVLLLDIDHFKRVNDRYGHLAGDAVLRGLARTLATSIREYDTAGRFGGEEFVAVLPNADLAAATVIAERVRTQINRFAVPDLAEGVDPSEPMRLSVSIGVACLHVHGQELADLLHSADRALYRSKATGRNRVTCADRGDERPEPVSTA